MPRFDVYGRFVVEAERDGDRWVVWRRGPDGTRTRLDDVPVPPETGEDELPRLLEDVFHEYGAPGRALVQLDETGRGSARPDQGAEGPTTS